MRAKEAIKQLASEGKLGIEAQTEIKTTEEVWGEIEGKTHVGIRQNGTKLTIQNLLNLSMTDFKEGKIEETEKPLREYLNQIFEIEELDIEIKHNSPKELIEKAKKAIKRLANEGKLIDEEPSETTEGVWGEIEGETIKGLFKQAKATIQNLQKLSVNDFTKGRIEETGKPLREYLNQIFEIEKIYIDINSKSSKEEIVRAKEAIRNLAIRGSFGELEKKEYIKSEIEEKQKEIQTFILQKINSIKSTSKPTNTSEIKFDSMQEYVIGEILEKYVINKEGEAFILETNTNFQVEIETNSYGQNAKLDFLISTEFTINELDSIVIEWHPFRLDLTKKTLQEKIKKEQDSAKKIELQEKLEKLKNKEEETITNLKLEYSKERQALAEQILQNDITIVETFHKQKDIESLYDFLKTNIITNSNFPETQEEFTTEFNTKYKEILDIQEMKKQRIARIEIEEYLEENNANSIEVLTEEEITKLWKKRFTFLGNQNTISERIKKSEAHTKKTNQETKIQYQRRNLIAFYNCDEYKLKDAELEAHIDQKIELIRSEISALESILEAEQDLEEIQETRELHTEDTQAEELVEPVEIYQEFKLTSY